MKFVVFMCSVYWRVKQWLHIQNKQKKQSSLLYALHICTNTQLRRESQDSKMFSTRRTREIRNSCAALFIEQGQTFFSSHFSFRSLSLFFPFSMHSVKQSSFLSQQRLLDRLYIKHDNSRSQKNPMRERKKRKHTLLL